MPDAPGHLDAATTLNVTREIRWFHHGPIPAAVMAWFDRLEGTTDYEERVDRYDLVAASRNAGVKYRNETYFDSKFLVDVPNDVNLPEAFRGRVEDWVKLSTPIDSAEPPLEADWVAVTKQIHTHRYLAPMIEDLGIEEGCEIEVVGISIGDVRAWSLCFESFGLPEHRAENFAIGFERVRGIDLPDEVRLTSDECYGYPTWLTAMAALR